MIHRRMVNAKNANTIMNKHSERRIVMDSKTAKIVTYIGIAGIMVINMITAYANGVIRENAIKEEVLKQFNEMNGNS